VPDPALHPDVAPLGFLLGTWSGEGEGDYPTVARFRFTEESVFWHVGKPFIGYSQRTWLEDGRPSHGESGYWRSPGRGRVELVVAHPNGIVEVSEGRVGGTVVTVASTVMARTSSAKEVDALVREIRVEDDVLDYRLQMAAVGVPLGFHLKARLRRVGDRAGGESEDPMSEGPI
jgi:THAP4-like, heme-binding beta-barrel domain